MVFSRSHTLISSVAAVDPLERSGSDRICCSARPSAVPVPGCGVETTQPITPMAETCLLRSVFFPLFSVFLLLFFFIFHFLLSLSSFTASSSFFFVFQPCLASVSLHFYTTPARSHLTHPGLATSAAPHRQHGWVEQILRSPCAGDRNLFLSFFFIHYMYISRNLCSLRMLQLQLRACPAAAAGPRRLSTSSGAIPAVC